jgi:hypothetical protein
MTSIVATAFSCIVSRGAVIAAEVSTRLLNSLRTLFAQVSCTPADEVADVRALAYSLRPGDPSLSAELMCAVDRPLPSRYLPPL